MLSNKHACIHCHSNGPPKEMLLTLIIGNVGRALANGHPKYISDINHFWKEQMFYCSGNQPDQQNSPLRQWCRCRCCFWLNFRFYGCLRFRLACSRYLNHSGRPVLAGQCSPWYLLWWLRHCLCTTTIITDHLQHEWMNG